MPLPPQKRRKALQALGHDRLAELTARFELEVADRRQRDAHVDAIVRARGLEFADVLRLLKREELQEMCAALELDATGREKELLIGRLVGPVDEGGDGPEVYAESDAPKPVLPSRDSAVAGAFALTPTTK